LSQVFEEEWSCHVDSQEADLNSKISIALYFAVKESQAAIAQLGERQTEDLKVTGSIPVRGNCFLFIFFGAR
jgi:hypothetical protein